MAINILEGTLSPEEFLKTFIRELAADIQGNSLGILTYTFEKDECDPGELLYGSFYSAARRVHADDKCNDATADIDFCFWKYGTAEIRHAASKTEEEEIILAGTWQQVAIRLVQWIIDAAAGDAIIFRATADAIDRGTAKLKTLI